MAVSSSRSQYKHCYSEQQEDVTRTPSGRSDRCRNSPIWGMPADHYRIVPVVTMLSQGSDVALYLLEQSTHYMPIHHRPSVLVCALMSVTQCSLTSLCLFLEKERAYNAPFETKAWEPRAGFPFTPYPSPHSFIRLSTCCLPPSHASVGKHMCTYKSMYMY